MRSTNSGYKGIIIAAVTLLIGLIAALVVFFFVRNFVMTWEMTKLPGIVIKPISAATPQSPQTGQTSDNVATPTPPPPIANGPSNWDGATRVNILVMGLDYRDWEKDVGPSRSDTMILLTIDPLAKTGGMLSIPRDLWVTIPGFKNDRINTAYALGEGSKLPGGGPALAAKTVEALLGVPIQYYAQVDFSAFVTLIDAIGGVKIDVTKEIKLDMIGRDELISNKKSGKKVAGDKSIKVLKPGKYNMSGELALAYARQRYGGEGDFDRAQRQQQVILAIRDRLLQFDRFGMLITEAPKLYQQVSSGVHTNMTFDEAMRLGWLAKDIPLTQIHKGAIGKDQAIFQSINGQSVLKPRPEQIRTLRDQVFASSASVSPIARQGFELAVQSEHAKIAVRNGSPGSGVAPQAGQYLTSLGLNVAETGDSNQAMSVTTIIDYTGNPYTITYLQRLLNLNTRMVLSKFDPNSTVDLALVVGNDWKQP
jgi:LCP family protein required for cell wall assembly